MKQCYLSGGPYLLFLDFVYEIDGLQFLFFLFLCSFVVFNIPDIPHFVKTIFEINPIFLAYLRIVSIDCNYLYFPYILMLINKFKMYIFRIFQKCYTETDAVFISV